MIICKKHVAIYRKISETIFIYHIADTQTQYNRLFYQNGRNKMQKSSDSGAQEQKQLELHEQLTKVEQLRESGIADIPAKAASAKLRFSLKG